MPESVILTIDGRAIELPVLIGSEGEKAIDITQLRAKTGYITYDPGFGNTGVCKSGITYIDGEAGILRYRGIPIEQFDREKPDFLEVAMLIIFGEEPKAVDLARFRGISTQNAFLDEAMKHHFEGFPVTAPPMAQLSAMINALSCFHPEFFTLGDECEFEEAAARLISKIRTIAAASYRRSKGLPLIYPNPRLRYAANFLHMMFSMPYLEHRVEPEAEDALNLIFILHADHEQNCSANAMRSVGSSHVDPFSATAGAIAALYGPLHGAANAEVLYMLDEIGSINKVPAFVKEVKEGKGRLMGFGHRVYKNYDPRAKIIKTLADQVFEVTGRNPKLDIALELERIALEDEYFIKRKLYPNVDFYSGLIYQAMGFPVEMFTVLFAIGRTSGWVSQWQELLTDPEQKIARPRQIFLGYDARDYVVMGKRT